MNAPITPPTWTEARAAYLAAKTAEDEYDRDFYMPAFHRCDAGGDSIPGDIETEIDRLQNLRHDAEGVLMDIPAPDAAGFAFKYLIARGDGRDANGWDGLLEREAKRFADNDKAGHLLMLGVRDNLLIEFNNASSINDDDAQPIADAALNIERLIRETSACIPLDILAKALLFIGEAALGENLQALAIFEEARAMGLMRVMA